MHLRTAGGEESAIVICIVPLPQTAVEILADAVAVLDPLHACAAYPSRPSFNASACLDPDLATSLDPPHRRLKLRCLSLNGHHLLSSPTRSLPNSIVLLVDY